MTYKVCIVCDEVIKPKDQVDYDVLAEVFKRDNSGDIYGEVPKQTKVYFHLNCFERYKKDDTKHRLIFTELIGAKRIEIVDIGSNRPFYDDLRRVSGQPFLRSH